MTHKQEAEDIVNSYRVILMEEDTDCGEEILCSLIAKKCALVDIQNTIYEARRWNSSYIGNERYHHFLAVKEEMQKL